MLTDAETVVLSPEWHVRPDYGQGTVYRFSVGESKYVRLTSQETVALALCDGHRPLGAVRRLLARMLNLEGPEAARVVEALLDKSSKYGEFLIPLPSEGGTFTRVNATRLLMELAAYCPEPQRVRRLQSPLSLLVIPSYACQADCIYCYAERPPGFAGELMSPRRWVEVLTEAAESGADLVTFSGGDPLTYAGLDELLRVACRYRMAFLLSTKTLVTRSRAERFAALSPRYGHFQISIDSVDPAVADLMSGVSDYAGRALESIGNLLAAGLSVRTNTVITPLNLAGAEDLLRELYRMGIRRANLTNYSRTQYRHRGALFLSASQIESLHGAVKKLQRELNWDGLTCNAAIRDFSQPGSASREAWEARAGCSGGSSGCVILPNGDVALCEQVPHDARFVLGNVARRSLLEVWNSSELIDFIAPERALFDGTACEDCEEFDACHRVHGRCFRDAFFTYGSLYAPSPNCPRAGPGVRMS